MEDSKPLEDVLEGARLESVTRNLQRLADGDGAAFGEVVSQVYGQLEELAHSHLRRHRSTPSLDTRALVHETYLKMLHQRQLDWQNRHHFFAVTSSAMRQIVVDHARRRSALKRGAGERPEQLDETAIWVSEEDCDEILHLDQVLERLAQVDEELRRLVEYRFFGGLTETEIAETLGVSERTVQRKWKRARAFLRREME